MNVEIRINNQVFPVGSKALAKFVEAVVDSLENKGLFDLLASHPSTRVKSEVAEKKHIGQDTFDALVLSGELPVLKNLMSHWNYSSKSHYLKDKYFQRLLESNNSEVLDLLIDMIHNHDVGAYSERADMLVKHENPDVRLALANSNASKELIRRLLDDQDADVQGAAKDSLDYDSSF